MRCLLRTRRSRYRDECRGQQCVRLHYYRVSMSLLLVSASLCSASSSRRTVKLVDMQSF
ncbi:hypothetical protein JOF55_000662 [Haloactinomyces albus]|uniref:Uncharacterized protein n=1 Tax=Haloactinomyces albus TaxID=1352928 RepID=A0AAE3ZB90_9ACTN|nr:hypothetical protein [Haloactinomyces albus]